MLYRKHEMDIYKKTSKGGESPPFGVKNIIKHVSLR